MRGEPTLFFSPSSTHLKWQPSRHLGTWAWALGDLDLGTGRRPWKMWASSNNLQVMNEYVQNECDLKVCAREQTQSMEKSMIASPLTSWQTPPSPCLGCPSPRGRPRPQRSSPGQPRSCRILSLAWSESCPGGPSRWDEYQGWSATCSSRPRCRSSRPSARLRSFAGPWRSPWCWARIGAGRPPPCGRSGLPPSNMSAALDHQCCWGQLQPEEPLSPKLG